MRILFIANHLNVGGITSYLLTLTSGLKEKGYDIYLASSGGEWADKFSVLGIKHIYLPLKTKQAVSPNIIFSFFRLKKEIKNLKIDLIHTHSRTTQVLGDLLSRTLGVVHIFTCHGFFKPKLSRRLFPCWGKGVIAISQEVKEHLINDLKLDAKKIAVINNGIDVKKFGDAGTRNLVRKNLKIESNDFLVGIIARLSDVKGHLYLIQAMQKVMQSFSNVKLLIVGQGKMQDFLVREVDSLGIKSNVIFLAKADNTQDLLSAMDVFVMPSLQEGLGLALMEAMAGGLAVVGSAVGGIKTLIQDKANGLLVAATDVSGLVKAITQLLDNPQMRAELGKNAQKFIIDNFSKTKMVNQTEEFYKLHG
ncbi:MAG: glycosyltransferase family 4 protein [Candidatus Omnitrophota bacterium]